jgi:hypothetical protein
MNSWLNAAYELRQVAGLLVVAWAVRKFVPMLVRLWRNGC